MTKLRIRSRVGTFHGHRKHFVLATEPELLEPVVAVVLPEGSKLPAAAAGLEPGADGGLVAVFDGGRGCNQPDDRSCSDRHPRGTRPRQQINRCRRKTTGLLV